MLENLWNQSGQDAMNSAPQPNAPVDQGQMDQAPAIPGQKVSFDVNQNPQDMQMMTDAMMYAPMLQSMDEEQRKEKWPQMVQSLSQVSPKASALFDPSLPPSDKDLEALMSKMPGNQSAESKNPGQLASNQDDFMAEQVKRQLRGEKPQSLIEYNAQKTQQEQEKEKLKPIQEAYNDSAEGLIQRSTQLATQSNQSKTAELIQASFAAIGNAVSEAIFPSAQAFSLDLQDPRYKNAPKNKRWKVDANGKILDELESIPGSDSDPTVKQADAVLKQYTKGTAPTAGVVGLLKATKDLQPTLDGNPWTDDWDLDTAALSAASTGNIWPRVKGIFVGKEATIKGEAYKKASNQRSEAIQKLMTGATSRQSEEKNYNDMFTCSPGDYAETCLQKVMNSRLFMKNIEHFLVDDPSTLTGKNIDIHAVQRQNAAASANIQRYYKDWTVRMLQKNPNMTQQDLTRLWIKSNILDPEFAAKVVGDADVSLKKKKQE